MPSGIGGRRLRLPHASRGRWGKQNGAGIIAAIASLFILPAAVLAGFGDLVYLVVERVVHVGGLDEPTAR